MFSPSSWPYIFLSYLLLPTLDILVRGTPPMVVLHDFLEAKFEGYSPLSSFRNNVSSAIFIFQGTRGPPSTRPHNVFDCPPTPRLRKPLEVFYLSSPTISIFTWSNSPFAMMCPSAGVPQSRACFGRTRTTSTILGILPGSRSPVTKTPAGVIRDLHVQRGGCRLQSGQCGSSSRGGALSRCGGLLPRS